MRLVLSVLTLPAFILIPNAHAGTISGQGGGFSGSGTLTTSSNGDGSDTITGIAGSGFGTLFSPGGYQQNDNQLFPGAANLVDSNGFAFTYTQGNTNYDVDILSSGSGTYAADFTDLDSNLLSSVAVTFTLTGASQSASCFTAPRVRAPTSSLSASIQALPSHLSRRACSCSARARSASLDVSAPDEGLARCRVSSTPLNLID